MGFPSSSKGAGSVPAMRGSARSAAPLRAETIIRVGAVSPASRAPRSVRRACAAPLRPRSRFFSMTAMTSTSREAGLGHRPARGRRPSTQREARRAAWHGHEDDDAQLAKVVPGVPGAGTGEVFEGGKNSRRAAIGSEGWVLPWESIPPSAARDAARFARAMRLP